MHEIKTEGVYESLSNDKEMFDCSNYSTKCVVIIPLKSKDEFVFGRW